MLSLDPDVASPDNNEVFPQAEHMGLEYDWDAPDSVSRLASFVPMERAPNLRAFHLDPETELTDIVTQRVTMAKGLLVSQRFWRALNGSRVQPHQRYPAEVVLRDDRRPYLWIHWTEDLTNRIDFSHSEFVIEPPGGGASARAEVESKEELARIVTHLVDTLTGDLVPRKVSFSPGTPSYDFLFLQLQARRLYVSEALAERLSASRLTGFRLGPVAAELVFP